MTGLAFLCISATSARPLREREQDGKAPFVVPSNTPLQEVGAPGTVPGLTTGPIFSAGCFQSAKKIC